MTTKLGKYLVVINFVISVVVAGWCAAFYFTAIDWSTNAGSPPEGPAPGQMVGRAARVKELFANSRTAEAGWREARFMVRDRERNRGIDRAVYQPALGFVYNMPNPKDQLTEVVVDANGQPVLEQDANYKTYFLPTLRAVNDRFGQPLHSLSYYAKAYSDNLATLKSENDKLVELSKKDADWTVDLTGGTKTDNTVVAKGLRKRIEDERVKGLEALAEFEVVKPLLIKTVGDSEFLLARRKQLEKRMKELQETKAAPTAQ